MAVYKTLTNPVYVMSVHLTDGITWDLEKNQVPNWFHRKMMSLMFGWKWEWCK